jgi:nanoRNase/pAp phosphatase (c-di-AMP/oligoRNAs hydrolase)
MIREMMIEIVENIPDESEKMKEEMVKLKRQRALDRRMVSGLAVSLVESIPGQAEATRVMENVLESMMTSVNRNMVWSILESRKDIQEWVTLRIKQ